MKNLIKPVILATYSWILISSTVHYLSLNSFPSQISPVNKVNCNNIYLIQTKMYAKIIIHHLPFVLPWNSVWNCEMEHDCSACRLHTANYVVGTSTIK